MSYSRWIFLLVLLFAGTGTAAPRNVANDPAYRQIIERMRADMSKFRAEARDPWLPGTSSPFGH